MFFEEVTNPTDNPEFWDVDYPRHELPLNLHTIYFELDDGGLYPTIEHPAECSIKTGCWYSEIYPEEIEPSIPEGTKLDGTQYIITAVHQSYLGLGYEYGETIVTFHAEISPCPC